MSRKRPSLDAENLANRPKQNEREKYLDALHWRVRDLIEELEKDNIKVELIAFETLWSIFSFFERGHSHEDLREAYPVKAWREDTVTVPRALLRPLVDAWKKYKEADAGKTLGECMNLEGGSSGKRPLKKVLEKINRDQTYSNRVLIEYFDAQRLGKRISFEKAIALVADREGVSETTVKRASEKGRTRALEPLQARKIVR